jgi:hypothetical protein
MLYYYHWSAALESMQRGIESRMKRMKTLLL